MPPNRMITDVVNDIRIMMYSREDAWKKRELNFNKTSVNELLREIDKDLQWILYLIEDYPDHEYPKNEDDGTKTGHHGSDDPF